MRLAGSVRTDEGDAFSVVDLVAERQKQVAHRHVANLGHAPCGIGTAQANVDVLIGNGWRRRARRDEFLPPGFGGVGLRGVLEVLGSALLHDLHVVEESTFLFVPSFEVVAEKFLTLLTGLGIRGKGATVHPASGAFDRNDLVRAPFQKGTVVAHHENGGGAGLQLILQPLTSGDVKIVVGLVQEQHIRPRVEQ